MTEYVYLVKINNGQHYDEEWHEELVGVYTTFDLAKQKILNMCHDHLMKGKSGFKNYYDNKSLYKETDLGAEGMLPFDFHARIERILVNEMEDKED